jgi:DNA-binding NarL/FixJ family response regulator
VAYPLSSRIPNELEEGGSADEALIEVARLKPDVVLSGIPPSRMGALDWVSRIKAAENAPLVFVLSSGDAPAYQAAAAAQGADGFVPKDAVDRTLLPMIRRLLARPRARTGVEEVP